MNISPQLRMNNSVNDSLESTFTEKNWKMQSEFVRPKGRGKKLRKESTLKNI